MKYEIDVEAALVSVRRLAAKATAGVMEDFEYYEKHDEAPEYEHDIETPINTAFLQLMNLAEALKLNGIYRVIKTTHRKALKIGLSKKAFFEDSSAWAYWATTLEQLADSIAAVYGLLESEGSVSTDLLTLLQSTQSAITDKRCFLPPIDETEVHDRIEAILRCVYPDILRKPPIAKAVKSFTPDNGIPTIKTLIEYKYVAQATYVQIVADQILADTRGYADHRWSRVVFVIYETRRFSTVYQWRQLLRDCDITNTEVVVLNGEAPDIDGTGTTKRKRK